jgi:hypothetical protein
MTIVKHLISVVEVMKMDVFEILEQLSDYELAQVAEEINDPSGVIPDDALCRTVAMDVFNLENTSETTLIQMLSLGTPLSFVLARRLLQNNS